MYRFPFIIEPHCSLHFLFKGSLTSVHGCRLLYFLGGGAKSPPLNFFTNSEGEVEGEKSSTFPPQKRGGLCPKKYVGPKKPCLPRPVRRICQCTKFEVNRIKIMPCFVNRNSNVESIIHIRCQHLSITQISNGVRFFVPSSLPDIYELMEKWFQLFFSFFFEFYDLLD